MVRTLGILSALLIGLILSSPAWSVGLGQIRLNSALNQPFDAEIELTGTQGLSREEILAGLASAEDFQRVGVERYFFLTELRFNVERRRDGYVLKVTSRQPIVEPFVNFVVEMRWPAGRMLREYTVLLDPPTFAPRAAPPVAAPQRASPEEGAAGRIERRTGTQVDMPRTPPSPTTPPTTLRTDPLSGETYGHTDRNDTLWRIATRSRAQGVSVEQQMLAIVRLNPDAFIGGNVNLLKAGYVLRLPDENQARSIGRQDAVTQVASHHEQWQSYRRTGTLSARTDAMAAPAPTPSQPADPPQPRQADATPAAPQRAPARETLPEGELRILAGDDAPGTGSAGLVELEDRLAASEDERLRMERENEEMAARLAQLNEQRDAARRQLELRDQEMARLQQQLEEARTSAPPAQRPAQEAEAEAGVVATLTANWTLIAGALGAVVVLAGLLMLQRRRAAAVADRRQAPMMPVASNFTLDDDYEQDADDTDVLDVGGQRGAAQEEEVQAPQTSDVIAEADIYIAYNRYPQALALLENVLAQDPTRADVRLKLLEVLVETQDTAGFDAQMSALMQHCDDEDVLFSARELETRLKGAESNSGAGLEASRNGDQVQAGGGDLDDFDLDLDELEMELESADAATAAPTLEPAPEAPSREESRGGSDLLGGDLGFDFDPDQESKPKSAAVAASAAASDDDFDFDLEGLTLDDEAEAAAVTQTRPVIPAAADESEEAVFDALDSDDEINTKLDLAKAYIDMGDTDGAREILVEVLQDGTPEQQRQAKSMMSNVG